MTDIQAQKIERLVQIIMIEVKKRKADKGVWSVVSLADERKVRNVLNPDVLEIVDGEEGKKELVKAGSNARTIRTIARAYHDALGIKIKPVRVYFKFDILSRPRFSFDVIETAMHEMVHIAELLHNLDKSENWQHTAFRERNAEFLGKSIHSLDQLRILEETLMKKSAQLPVNKSNSKNALLDFLDVFLELSDLERGMGAVHTVRDAVREKHDTGEFLYWPPDRVELWALLGAKIQIKDILEHYESGACGEELKKAARLVAMRLSQEEKMRQDALTFTKVHHMSEQEAKEHMKMVEDRIRSKRKMYESEMYESEFYAMYNRPMDMIPPIVSLEKTSAPKKNVSPKATSPNVAAPSDSGPAWYSHWECINCRKKAKTQWNEYPGGQCPKSKGGGNHNWSFVKKTDT